MDIHQHLPQVLVGKTCHLQINDDIALQPYMIKYKIRIEMVPVQGQSLLTAYECESVSQFQEKFLKVEKKKKTICY